MPADLRAIDAPATAARRAVRPGARAADNRLLAASSRPPWPSRSPPPSSSAPAPSAASSAPCSRAPATASRSSPGRRTCRRSSATACACRCGGQRRDDPRRGAHRPRRGARRRSGPLLRQVDRHRGGRRARWRRTSTTAPLVLSLQNGVENAATIARHVRQTVVPAVVYVAHGDARAGRRRPPRARRSRHRRARREGGARRGARGAAAGARRSLRRRRRAGAHLGRRRWPSSGRS